MEQEKNKLFEIYKEIDGSSIQAVEEQIIKHFKNPWIYAVLDFAVGFGIYKDNTFLLRLGSDSEPIPLDWKYLQELRAFDKQGELRLTRIKNGWGGRYRGTVIDDQKEKEEFKGFFIDEKQKFWGKVIKCEMISDMPWSLLASDRGTRIWVPIKLKKQEEAAIRVRKFMETPEDSSRGLVYQTDIRLVDFCLWNGNTKEGE